MDTHGGSDGKKMGHLLLIEGEAGDVWSISSGTWGSDLNA